jgi:hypothetical protein
MDNHNPPPWWIPLLFGFAMIGMGVLIVCLVTGIFPMTRGAGDAPRWVMVAIAGGLILGGFLMILPQESPAFIRSILGLGALVLAAVVCNWTAFAPGVHYSSEVSFGPVSVWGEDQVGGRIMFGLAALAVDALLGWVVFYEVRKRLGK